MADSVAFVIVNNIKDALHAEQIMEETATAELERLSPVEINDRYPFCVVVGPEAEIEAQTPRLDQTRFSIGVQCFVEVNDDSQDVDTEIAYLTRNVASDIIKLVRANPQRKVGAVTYAQNTKTTGYGHAFEEVDGIMEFYVWVSFEVVSRVDSDDPTLLA